MVFKSPNLRLIDASPFQGTSAAHETAKEPEHGGVLATGIHKGNTPFLPIVVGDGRGHKCLTFAQWSAQRAGLVTMVTPKLF